MDVCFRPSGAEGEGEGEIVLKCDELGTYPYRVEWKATAAPMEGAVVFKAPLGRRKRPQHPWKARSCSRRRWVGGSDRSTHGRRGRVHGAVG